MNHDYWKGKHRTLPELALKLSEETGEVAKEVGLMKRFGAGKKSQIKKLLAEELDQVIFIATEMKARL